MRTHHATIVRQDSTGTWLFSPEGTVATDEAGEPAWTQPADGMQFFPASALPRTGGWYVAWCWEVGPDPTATMWNHRWISVDLSMRPGAGAAEGPYDFVDLELDLWCGPQGRGIVDQDDLVDAVAHGRLSAAQAAVVTDAAAEIHGHLSEGYENAFSGVGWALLDERRG